MTELMKNQQLTPVQGHFIVIILVIDRHELVFIKVRVRQFNSIKLLKTHFCLLNIHLYTCVFVYMCACLLYVCARMFICAFIFIYCVCLFVYMYLHVSVFSNIHTCVWIGVYKCVYLSNCVCVFLCV